MRNDPFTRRSAREAGRNGRELTPAELLASFKRYVASKTTINNRPSVQVSSAVDQKLSEMSNDDLDHVLDLMHNLEQGSIREELLDDATSKHVLRVEGSTIGYTIKDGKCTLEYIDISGPSISSDDDLSEDFARQLEERLREKGVSEANSAAISNAVLEEFSADERELVEQLDAALDLATAAAVAALSIQAKINSADLPHLADREPQESPTAESPLSLPEGNAPKYQGKRKSGPVDAFLRASYPFRPDAPALSLRYLRDHDPKAVRAYNRLNESDRQKLGLSVASDAGDELLASKGIQFSTPAGIDEARRLRSVIQSRLQRLDLKRK